MKKKGLLYFSLFVLSAIGIRWAFIKGADDFRVFHSAWQQVLNGTGIDVYDFHKMPDRFLYVPGFAWILAPLGYFSFRVSLAVWCLAKFVALVVLVKNLARVYGEWATLAALLFVARPLMIDFQYGQVNIWILFFTYFALITAREAAATKTAKRFFSWFSFTVISIAKVFTAPLLFVSFLSRKNKLERFVLVSTVALLFLLPAFSYGLSTAFSLHEKWFLALQSRGLPLDSHNQSVSAFLLRWFTGEEIRVIPWGPKWVSVGRNIASVWVLKSLSIAWFFTVMGWMAWVAFKKQVRAHSYAGMLVALSFLPSHLIWKPYFLLGLPLYAFVLHEVLQSKNKWQVSLFGFVFLLLNFTSVDFVGYRLGGLFEVSSVFLWVHLVFCFYGTKFFLRQSS